MESTSKNYASRFENPIFFLNELNLGYKSQKSIFFLQCGMERKEKDKILFRNKESV
jgi:hypothetical protein